MKPTFLQAISLFFASLIVVIIVALWRHKKASGGDIKLIGELAQVTSRLDPEGAVLVRGELWRATSFDGVVISSDARVRVVGFKDHLVLVELCD